MEENASHHKDAHPARTFPVQTYARVGGALFLLTMIGGGLGELYIPSNIIVSADANATAHNVRDLNTLFRVGFIAYLLEAVADVALSWIFYRLLRPVNQELALLAAFFGLVSTSVFAAGQLFSFAPAMILGNAEFLKTFSPDQMNTLALVSFKLAGLSAGIFMVFYGIAAVIRGYLIIQSHFLPKFLGAVLLLAGFCFAVRNLLLVLSPKYASDLLLAPMFIALLLLTLWLLIKGVDRAKWESLSKYGEAE